MEYQNSPQNDFSSSSIPICYDQRPRSVTSRTDSRHLLKQNVFHVNSTGRSFQYFHSFVLISLIFISHPASAREDMPLTHRLGADQSMQIWSGSLKHIQRRTFVGPEQLSVQITFRAWETQCVSSYHGVDIKAFSWCKHWNGPQLFYFCWVTLVKRSSICCSNVKIIIIKIIVPFVPFVCLHWNISNNHPMLCVVALPCLTSM